MGAQHISLSPRPSCPQHPEAKVWLDGTYGSGEHRRQRYKCVLPNGSMHVFTEKLPRKRPPEGECQECEHTFQPHEGPQTPRQYAFTTREVAAALVKVGEGQTYRSAGYFARRRAERLKISTSGYKYATKHPNAVLDWVGVFAPSIYGRYSPQRWPEMLILDHAPVHIAKQHPSGYPKQSGKLAFCVFGAVGYERGRSPRVWKLAAYPTPTRANWIDFLSSLEGRPRHILTDEATGLLKAIPLVWPETPNEPAPCVFLCHYHLWKQAYEILRKHRLHGKKRKLRIALDKAFQSRENWVRFVILAERHMRFIPMPRLERWIKPARCEPRRRRLFIELGRSRQLERLRTTMSPWMAPISRKSPSLAQSISMPTTWLPMTGRQGSIPLRIWKS